MGSEMCIREREKGEKRSKEIGGMREIEREEGRGEERKGQKDRVDREE